MPTIEAFFQEAKDALALDPSLTYQHVRTYSASAIEQLLAGRLIAATQGFELFLHDRLPLPQAHDLDLVVDEAGQPQALRYTEEVFIEPFATIDEAHARLEGATDLATWRTQQTAALSQQYADAGMTFDPDDAMVVNIRFRVLYPLPTQNA